MKKIINKGISLIEVLVVILIFAILGILISRIILVTLRGSGKSDSLVKIRENLDYSLSVMEREIRNSETVDCSSSTQVDYINSVGIAGSFSCQGSRIASGSAMLTSEEVNITSCSFVCTPATGHVPPSVTISLEARDTRTTGPEAARATVSTQIFLRTY